MYFYSYIHLSCESDISRHLEWGKKKKKVVMCLTVLLFCVLWSLKQAWRYVFRANICASVMPRLNKMILIRIQLASHTGHRITFINVSSLKLVIQTAASLFLKCLNLIFGKSVAPCNQMLFCFPHRLCIIFELNR